MFRILIPVLFLGAVIAAAMAQPPTARPPTTTPDLVERINPRLALPLSREEAERLLQRFQASVARQMTLAPGSALFRSAGLPAETDAVERADAAGRTGRIGPLEFGLAGVPPRHPRDAVDPWLAEVTRTRLQARLGHEPSAAEQRAGLQEFDARVARTNRWLAEQRVPIAKAFADTGSLPPAFDSEALDPPRSYRQTDSPQEREGFRALFRSLLAQPDPAGTDTPPPVFPDPRIPLFQPHPPGVTTQPLPGPAAPDPDR